ncbi:MAG TPA: nuclear transport factor 2 family protein [Rhizomicrobium sp.]|jgi:ketosteroid isomerase-like protein|nr:nuclear transport factor 2 family protein [Rhizomicrobium sp.]
MSHADDMNMLADRIMRAIENNDCDTVADCYAPDARIWHNFDGIEQTVPENLQTLVWMDGRLKKRRYEIVSRDAFVGGYVQRHVLHGTLTNGAAFAMPACLVVTVTDGKIVYLAEYLDTAHGKALSLR